MIPDPVPLDLFRDLVGRAGGTRHAARLAHCDDRAVRRWLEGQAPIPWSIAYAIARQLDDAEPV